MPNWISILLTNTFFLTWVGAVCGHVLSLYSKDFKGCKPFLEKILPNNSDTFYHRIDFLLLPFIGAILAFVLLDPISVKSSIFAGISWSGAITALLRNSNTKISEL